MFNDAEYPLAICISSFEKCIFISLTVFLFVFMLLICFHANKLSSLCILSINFLSYANIFSHSIDCLFSLLIISFAVQIFSLMQLHFPIFALLPVLSESYSKIHWPDEQQEAFPQFYVNSFLLIILVIILSFFCSSFDFWRQYVHQVKWSMLILLLYETVRINMLLLWDRIIPLHLNSSHWIITDFYFRWLIISYFTLFWNTYLGLSSTI